VSEEINEKENSKKKLFAVISSSRANKKSTRHVSVLRSEDKREID